MKTLMNRVNPTSGTKIHEVLSVGQIVVHNTDSLYVACHPKHFIEDDRSYFVIGVLLLVLGGFFMVRHFRKARSSHTEFNSNQYNIPKRR